MRIDWEALGNNRSVKMRFFVTLTVNVMRMGLSFLTGLIVARNLGPEGYGDFSFLLGSFISINTLLDMSTSTAFYTFLSQKALSRDVYLYYGIWVAVQFLITFALVSFIFPDTWRDRIWLGHSRGIVVLAFVASYFMNKIWQTVGHIGESIRYTVVVQLNSIVLAAVYLLVVIILGLLHDLKIANLFVAIIFIYAVFSAVLGHRLKDSVEVADGKAGFADIFGEFRDYCTPLVICGIVGFAHSFASLWLLQRFGGAAQQGYYSVGLRFSAVCLVATTAMLKVFWKETAEANEKGDGERLKYLYFRISRTLCFVGAVGSCFLALFSREILSFSLGPEYEAGWLCLAVMFLFPIHQSLGQIYGSYSFATAQTGLYSRMSIAGSVAGIAATYFVLASRTAPVPGLGLGSSGLAVKMVVEQIIMVNIFGFFICRVSGWKFDLLYQFESIALLLCGAFLSRSVMIFAMKALNVPANAGILMAGAFFVYLPLAAGTALLFPGLLGMDRQRLLAEARNLCGSFHSVPKNGGT